MKRISLLLFLFIYLPSLFCQEWYRSNSLGMKLEQIAVPLENGWEMEIFRDNPQENYILYQNGQENKRWERVHLENGEIRETYTEEGTLISITRWNEMGQVLEDQLDPFEGVFKIHRLFEYPEKNLILRSWLNHEGDTLGTDRIRLREDGSLLSISREGYSQSWADRNSESSYNPSDWLNRDSFSEITYYTIQGKPELILRMDQKDIISEETHHYLENGNLEKITISDYQLERDILQFFNSRGAKTVEEVYRGNLLVSRTTFRYTENDLTEKILEGRGQPERWLYTYQEGNLIQEDYYLGDQLIQRIDHQEGNIE